MKWSDIASTVGKAAPIIGTLLGGPLGGAVGGLVSSALGVSNTPDDVNAALAADPTALEKLKEAELNSKVQLQQLLVQQEQQRLVFSLQSFQAEAGDRNSARDLAKAQPRDYTRQIITYMMLVIVAAVVIFVFGGWAKDVLITTTGSLFIGTLVGYIFNELKQVLAFWFGATNDTSAQQKAITAFAVSPGTVSTGAPTDTPAPVTNIVNNTQGS